MENEAAWGISSVWESVGFASRKSPVRARYSPRLESTKSNYYIRIIYNFEFFDFFVIIVVLGLLGNSKVL